MSSGMFRTGVLAVFAMLLGLVLPGSARAWEAPQPGVDARQRVLAYRFAGTPPAAALDPARTASGVPRPDADARDLVITYRFADAADAATARQVDWMPPLPGWHGPRPGDQRVREWTDCLVDDKCVRQRREERWDAAATGGGAWILQHYGAQTCELARCAQVKTDAWQVAAAD